MKRLFILILLLSNSLVANNLPQIRNVLKHVETNYRTSIIGDGGDSYGILQIQEAVIVDVNRKYGTKYTHQDALNEACAGEIFILYIKMWSKNLEKKEDRPVTEDDIVRMWNGGPSGYKRSSTLNYLSKYNKYKSILVMNKRECIVNKKMGIIMKTNTYTYDIFMCKTKITSFGVSKKVVHLLPVKPTAKQIRLKTQYALSL
jgi:hypothetical protein